MSRQTRTIEVVTGARDFDFLGHAAEAAALAPPELVAPHEPRPIRFLRRERAGAWRLKLYGIALPGREVRAELVEAAMERAPSVFPAPARADGRYGVGYVTVHDAATSCLVLYYWWQSANECHYRVYASPLDDPTALTKIEDPGVGCVWELAIVDFESRAWLRRVLDNPDGPDLDRYLADHFDADV